MGTSHSKEINLLVTEIWDFCIKNNIWITVAHIPGKHNVIADFESRRGTNDTEWALDQTVYDQEIQLLDVTPSIDLFASRLNYKCKPYIAFRPRLAPSLSRMGFDRVYPVYYEISFELETENERDL